MGDEHVQRCSSPKSRSAFEAWWSERSGLERELAQAGDREDDYTESLLSRLHELEQLILETPSSELVAIQIKADLLVWLMEMETADGREAMSHIRDYLRGL